MRIGSDIATRLLEFAVGAIRVATLLPKDRAGRHVSSQLICSATGGGSNYEEARAAESRDDFIHKVGIAAKEVRESIYWLQLIERSKWTHHDLSTLTSEACELAAILGDSARTARSRQSY